MKPAFNLHAPQTGTDYVIFVEPPLPGSAAGEKGPFPAVFFMDGDDQFRFAVAAYHELRAADRVPPLLLIGVGYGASYTKPANKRLRDYTPTAMATEPESGGAATFLTFLTDTLWPEIARRYPVREEARGVAGHSLGALMAVEALRSPAPFFTRLLASAPSLWWDERSALRLLRERRERSAELPAKLFLSVGADDTHSMTGDLTLLEEQLAAQPFSGLDWQVRRFAGRDHYTVLPEAFRAGLLALYG